MLWTGMLLCSLVTLPVAGGGLPVHSPQNASVVEGQWTWTNGSDRVSFWRLWGFHGTKGVAAPGNRPGAREDAVSWKDASGAFWLFGGDGYAALGSTGFLNDLWRWDGIHWTWMSGSDEAKQPGAYGTKGVAAPTNVPGARVGAVSWTDASGGLWLFGGYGYTQGGLGYLNDVWKWDGASWTWIAGSNTLNQPGSYGTKGIASPSNIPGARNRSVSWTDANGNLWLFGGYGLAQGGSGFLNDLWKWDGTSWTWMGGSNAVDQPGAYGTRGVAAPGNVPGARSGAASWKDASGSLWLFGGYGYGATGSGYLNDLWKWDGTTWTWVSGSDAVDQPGTYGTKGIAAPGNVPGARSGAVSWTDAGGILWLFGGVGHGATGYGQLNDLWKWDGASWTWSNGSNFASPDTQYGSQGVPAPGNTPGGRGNAVAWTDAVGSLWLFGGIGMKRGNVSMTLGDLWRWDGTNWMWSGGDGESQSGTYGTRGVASPDNFPGWRSGAVSFTDGGGDRWLFGGYAATLDYDSRGFLNDLWSWDGTSWTWMSGSNDTDEFGTYGTKGGAAPTNVPGARDGAVSWTDAGGNLWLFGGKWNESYSVGDVPISFFNDLWRWDGANWTWMSGSNVPNQLGTYGTKGLAAPGNVPGAREGAVSFTDAAGNFWLFGGYGYGSSGSGQLNDLWKWDGTNWAWVSGSNVPWELGAYGTKGVAAPDNVPGARAGAVSFTDAAGSLWLFGGLRVGAMATWGLLNDLWRWDGTNWTWMSGSSAENQPGVYGTRGVAGADNTPGAREEAVSWTDAIGNLWLFGGSGFAATADGLLNDLWKWNGTSWTWVAGSDTPNQPGISGSQGVATPSNVPGARSGAVSWSDASGNPMLFGGYGYDAIGLDGDLRDIWVFGAQCAFLDPPTAGNRGPYTVGATVSLTASSVPGATYLWTGANGFTSTEQNPTIPNATTAMAGLYSVRAFAGDCTSPEAATTVVVLGAQTLAVSRIGSGSGSVTSAPEGIACGAGCIATFPGLSQVTLTATPDAGSRFAGWAGGGCFGTEPCTVTMDGATSISAMFLPSGGVGFHTITPCRVVDTRNAAGPYGGPALSAGAARAFAIAGQCGVPADASAVALNITVVNPSSAGSLTLYPGTGIVPGATTISFVAGRTRANNATVALIDGFLSVFDHQESGTTDVIIDMSGYYR
jgi:hypothetical protein